MLQNLLAPLRKTEFTFSGDGHDGLGGGVLEVEAPDGLELRDDGVGGVLLAVSLGVAPRVAHGAAALARVPPERDADVRATAQVRQAWVVPGSCDRW